jgi:IS605 OrfB family transposase
MKILKAYRFRLKTNPEIEDKFGRQSGCTRFVWNKALSLNKERLEHKIPLIWYNDMAGFLQLWKQSEEYEFLKEAHSQVLQQSLKDLEKAFKDFLNHDKGFPKFKKKDMYNSFRYPQGFKIEGNRIFLPKIGWVGFFKSRDIRGIPKNVTIKKENSHWYVSIQTEEEIPEQAHPKIGSIIGIDVGIVHFASISDGTLNEQFIDFPSPLQKYEKKLVHLQRKLSRKKKFSKNWIKQKNRISKIHEDISNIRKDYLHKASTAIAKNHGIVGVEDLKIKNMTKSARGTIEDPGHNVRAKSGLNRAILDQGWGMFKEMLEYKLNYSGGMLVSVSAKYTSLTCPVCGNVSKENRESQVVFACKSCGFMHNADWVGAENVRKKTLKELGLVENTSNYPDVGHTMEACGGKGHKPPCEAGTSRKEQSSTALLESLTSEVREDVNKL